MKRFSRALVATFGFVVLGCVGSMVPQKSATGSDTRKPTGGHTENVDVVNTPLPVSGTVNVGNTASVSVANTPTVNLGSGTSVNVSNPQDSQNNPTPVATLETIQPYEDFCSAPFGGAPGGNCNFQTVPSTKRLVIQEVDVRVGVDTGVKPAVIYLVTKRYPSILPRGPFLRSDVHGQPTRLGRFCHAPGNTPLCGQERNAFMPRASILGFCDWWYELCALWIFGGCAVNKS